MKRVTMAYCVVPLMIVWALLKSDTYISFLKLF